MSEIFWQASEISVPSYKWIPGLNSVLFGFLWKTLIISWKPSTKLRLANSLAIQRVSFWKNQINRALKIHFSMKNSSCKRCWKFHHLSMANNRILSLTILPFLLHFFTFCILHFSFILSLNFNKEYLPVKRTKPFHYSRQLDNMMNFRDGQKNIWRIHIIAWLLKCLWHAVGIVSSVLVEKLLNEVVDSHACPLSVKTEWIRDRGACWSEV